MPSLTPVAFEASTNKPFVWICSECGVLFSPTRINFEPGEIDEINTEFTAHSEKEHHGSSILRLKKPREDVN
jgi:hypothetical protein